MITQSTVLVLGAGASQAYGFPLGRDLPRIVTEALAASSECSQLLQACGHTPQEIQGFLLDFQASDSATIDDFLRRQFPPRRTLGRRIIAYLIARREQAERLSPSGTIQGRWYRHVRSALFDGSDSPPQNNHLAILTFNYDRSWPAYFDRVIPGTYPALSMEQVDALRKSVVYAPLFGSIAAMPFEHGNFQRPYSGSDPLNASDLAQMGDRLQVATEGLSPSTTPTFVSNILRAAQGIFFLGFGYHDANMQCLQWDILRSELHGKKICGTLQGHGELEKAAIRSRIPEIQFFENTIDELFTHRVSLTS